MFFLNVPIQNLIYKNEWGHDDIVAFFIEQMNVIEKLGFFFKFL